MIVPNSSWWHPRLCFKCDLLGSVASVKPTRLLRRSSLAVYFPLSHPSSYSLWILGSS
ncbi:hypothetical protein CPT_Slocum_096 [Serratia phage Slocum]|nr:hypothetical protein CPT_Slocum_096 [Serratia phage Slocum]